MDGIKKEMENGKYCTCTNYSFTNYKSILNGN